MKIVSRGTWILRLAIAALVVVTISKTAHAQYAITSTGAKVDYTGYGGLGFQPTPTLGQLDSDNYQIVGMSVGTLNYGDTQIVFPSFFARGQRSNSGGGIGMFSYETSPGDTSFGWRQANNDLTPGTFTIRFQNTTGAPVTIFGFRYLFYTLNVGGRSLFIHFSWSTDNVNFTPVPALNYATPFAADATGWTSQSWFTSANDFELADGVMVYLRWDTDDNPGTPGMGVDITSFDNIEIVLRGCGDGTIGGTEACDDSNTTNNDGCSSVCAIEDGWTCIGEPSECVSNCGDGNVSGTEGCDDSNVIDGDGCDALCAIEEGYFCVGEPSLCETVCGDGLMFAGDACDDANTDSGDGCNDQCELEPGWNCSGAPTLCASICGDGLPVGSEGCDDDNLEPLDGCDYDCNLEYGWTCTGAPSACEIICGDGISISPESCDDGNLDDSDGCTHNCELELFWSCAGQAPTICNPVCGDGESVGNENCDDGNAMAGDGCSDLCRVEQGYACVGQPDTCTTDCGDGAVGGVELCDDGNLTDGDGCDATCEIEGGFTCSGSPSDCVITCGDGLLTGNEACDDGNVENGDGCNLACVIEAGYLCTGVPSECLGDSDGDGFGDYVDNCPNFPNQSLADVDRDGVGDDCDPDSGGPGGGCQTEPASTGSVILFAFAVLTLLSLRRRRDQEVPLRSAV